LIEPPGVANHARQNAQYITREIAKMNGHSRVALSIFSLDDGTSASVQVDGTQDEAHRGGRQSPT
jgi:hypothetical protein